MTLDEYQKNAITFDIMNDDSKPTSVLDAAYIAKILGLSGEAGEVTDKYKKIIRDKQGIVSAEDKMEIAKELGDVLWYIAVISKYLGVPLEEVAKFNIDKLSSRKSRGKMRGDGDNR